MTDLPLLSLITWLPVAGAIVLLAVRQEAAARLIGLLTSGLVFILFIILFTGFETQIGLPQFVENTPWIDALGVSYHFGVDGISLLLAGITVLVWPLALLGSWKSVTTKIKEYQILMLLMETTLLGVFFSLDLFLFYLFWEAMLIPMYFLIGIWGDGKSADAAVKFFIYAVFGSLLMLFAIIGLAYIHFQIAGTLSFDMATLYNLSMPLNIQIWLALAFIIAFAVKVPMVPFHTWLPDAIVLAVVLVKMAGYGFIRLVLPLFPEALPVLAPWVCAFAVIGILYGGFIALAQSDMKKLVAYSTISHAGFVILGVFALNQHGIQGAVLQIVSLALSTGGLFLAMMMLNERRNSWLIEDYGGLWHTIPVFSVFFMIFTLASLGLPGLSNFIGEFLILVGIFERNILFAIFAAFGVILAAAYMLRMYKHVIFGPTTRKENREMNDLSPRETIVLACITVMIIWIGVYPNPFLRTMEASVQQLLTQTNQLSSAEQIDQIFVKSTFNLNSSR
jgi:NADH-quinone oxidoreductase subunit M